MALYIDGKKAVNSLVIDGNIDNLIPISWWNETHNVQQNRTITIDGYNLNATISQQSYSVGVLSIPITMPENCSALLLEYDLVGVSYTDETYYPTIFCSDTQITGVTTQSSDYGWLMLKQESLSSGEDDRGLTLVTGVPSNSFYFNIQFGVSNFENLRLYAVSKGNVSGGGGSSIPTLTLYSGKINLANGQIWADSNYYYSDYFDAPNGSLMFDLGEADYSGYVGLEMCTANGSHYDYYSPSRYRALDHSGKYSVAPKMRISFKAALLNAVIVKNLVDGTAYSVGNIKLDAGNS